MHKPIYGLSKYSNLVTYSYPIEINSTYFPSASINSISISLRASYHDRTVA